MKTAVSYSVPGGSEEGVERACVNSHSWIKSDTDDTARLLDEEAGVWSQDFLARSLVSTSVCRTDNFDFAGLSPATTSPIICVTRGKSYNPCTPHSAL